MALAATAGEVENPNPYADGIFVFSYGGGQSGWPDPATSLWSKSASNEDALFRAEFASASYLLEALRLKASTVLKVGSSLVDKASIAQSYFDAKDIYAACAIMDDFQVQILALSGKKIESEFAIELITDAEFAMRAMACD